MSIVQPILTLDQITEITTYVNNYRKLNQAPPLKWNADIQSFSTDWSYYLLANNLFEHSGTTLYGENLAFFQGYGTDVMVSLKLAIDAWYNEIISYDFKNPGFSDATGHFTCLVWAASTNYAIGITINKTTNSVVITMNTSPPGNVTGEFEANVLPRLPSPTPTPTPVPNPPTPTPTPTPTPIPVPNPPAPPIPISNTALILKIINNLNNIIYSISRRQPKYFILNYINIVIAELTTLQDIPISASLIQNLNFIIHAIRTKGYSQNIINSLNNMITQLKQYL